MGGGLIPQHKAISVCRRGGGTEGWGQRAAEGRRVKKHSPCRTMQACAMWCEGAASCLAPSEAPGSLAIPGSVLTSFRAEVHLPSLSTEAWLAARRGATHATPVPVNPADFSEAVTFLRPGESLPDIRPI